MTHRERPRVAIVGAGAVGGAIGAQLAGAGRLDVVVCVRSRFETLVLEAPSGTLEARPLVVTDPASAEPAADWILLATKAYDTAAAAAWFAALRGPATTIAVLQNGVEHEERVRPLANGMKIVPVVVSLAAARSAPGRVKMRGGARLTVAAGADGERFAQLFRGTAIEVDRVADFETRAWRKLCTNVAGAVTALTGSPLGVIRRPDVAEFARGLVRETIRVAEAEGAILGDDLADSLIGDLQRGDPEATPSILQDLREGRPLEWDARNGAVVRAGARHGIATPLNAAACALLAALSERNLAPPGGDGHRS